VKQKIEAKLKILEEKILDEHFNLVQKIQPELEKHFFYDVMPSWKDFREYRTEELAHESK